MAYLAFGTVVRSSLSSCNYYWKSRASWGASVAPEIASPLSLHRARKKPRISIFTIWAIYSTRSLALLPVFYFSIRPYDILCLAPNRWYSLVHPLHLPFLPKTYVATYTQLPWY